MIKMLIFLALLAVVIFNYPKTKAYLLRDFGIRDEHSALIVLGCIIILGILIYKI